MTRVAILWHMHQPYYGDATTGEQLLPWVRMHALKDYLGMVELLREFPTVRVTFNLVPSLVSQLDALATGRGRDRYFELAMKPAAALTTEDRMFLVANFFLAQRTRMIDPYPRYAQLLAKRDEEPGPNDEDRWRRAAARFTEPELRDLQVWHQLTWIDPLYRTDARIRGLLDRQRDFTEADKRTLADVEAEILRRVIPAYRDAARRGQVELSSSPFYHPILPLLCDATVYEEMHPGVHIGFEFTRPDDARAQLARAVACHQEHFGEPPAGMWPPEGGVSEAMVPLVAGAGFRWMATDEAILGKSLGVVFRRDANGFVEQPDLLYRPYAVRVGGREVGALFRDHRFSDLVGFTYANWSSEAAGWDFVGRLQEAGRRFRERTGGEEATIAVVLDGENAWEFYEGDGRPFLRTVYALLADNPEIVTVTMSEATRTSKGPAARASEAEVAVPASGHGETRVLDRLAPGSWAMGDFYIWIGHEDDRKAWRQLADARRVLEEARPTVTAEVYRQALEHVYIAEGSDWFWWYGDDHSSDQDLEFDILFRSHIRRIYQLLGRPAPESLLATNITEGAKRVEIVQPSGLLEVPLDGSHASEPRWSQAGHPVLKRLFGAMRQESDDDSHRVRDIRFGFDTGSLLVRIAFDMAARQVLADGVEVDLAFVEPAGLRVAVAGRETPTGRVMRQTGPEGWTPAVGETVRVAVGDVIEVALPTSALGGASRISFFVAVKRGGSDVAWYPSYAPIVTQG
jgi:alpha-amylase/alpha-mannosidase (GH57 family)